MTQSVPSHDPGAPVAPAAPAATARPGMITGAGITLIVLGVLTVLIGLFVVLGAAIFAGAAGGIDSGEVPGLGGMFGAFAGAILFLAIIVLGFGVLQFVTGLNVMGGRSWARITGIVVAAIGALFALAGIGDASGAVISIVLVAANAFVIYALAVGGEWFASRAS